MKNFISIPKPCYENWENMTPEEQGRHCSKCNIVVKDFTTMSNEEILKYLEINTTRTCGRVRNQQLYKLPSLNTQLRKFLYAFALIFLPFIAIPSTAQIKPNSLKDNYFQISGAIKGKILDDKGNPVPFASLGVFQHGVLKGQSKTNLNGKFVIKPLTCGTYSLRISSVGFVKTELKGIIVNSGKSTLKNVKLKKKIRCVTVGIIIRTDNRIDPQRPGRKFISGSQLNRLPDW